MVEKNDKIQEVKIGNLNIKSRIFLAPMHHINDIAFRRLCAQCGAGLVWTELTSPESLVDFDKLKLFDDKPVIQLVSNRVKCIKKFIKKYDKFASMWDFNLGCPSSHAKQSGVGYGFSKNLKGIDEVLKEMQGCTKKPLCVKIRKMSKEHTKKIIKIAEKYCDVLAIHARTMKQGYSGEVDVKFALWVKKNCKLPIIFSGDIVNKSVADDRLNEFDFIMIGRATMGNPCVFSQVLGLNCGKKVVGFRDYLKLAKKYNVDVKLIKLHAMQFTKGKSGASKARVEIGKCKSLKEIMVVVKKYEL
jgi:tRNA-dihydrouridine synthase B